MADPEHVAKLKEGVEAWNLWREANPAIIPDLVRVNLNEVLFKGLNLSRSLLEGARLRWARLVATDFRGARLADADFRWADLRGVRLEAANLNRARFDGTVLVRSHLDQCSMDAAVFNETVISNVDLTAVRGLESIHHLGPSTLDLQTLRYGVLPSRFLRGCGISDRLVDYLPSLLGSAIEFYSCFISYSHTDASFARRLHDALQGRGIRCWLDEKELLPGDDFHDKIDRGIKIWDKVLLCASKASLNSPWVDRELEKAFQKEERLWKEHGEKVLALVPLNLDGHLFTGAWSSGKASMVTGRLAADFTGWEHDNAKFEREFEKVVRALRTGDGGRETPPAPRL